MKVFKLEVLVVDHNGYGAEGIKGIIEHNDSIYPDVMNITERDIGEWSDDHPLNILATREAEYNRLFQIMPASGVLLDYQELRWCHTNPAVLRSLAIQHHCEQAAVDAIGEPELTSNYHGDRGKELEAVAESKEGW